LAIAVLNHEKRLGKLDGGGENRLRKLNAGAPFWKTDGNRETKRLATLKAFQELVIEVALPPIWIPT
jgi:hypothetical protein